MKKYILLFSISSFLSVAAIAQWNFDAPNAESVSGSYKKIDKKAALINTSFKGGELGMKNDNSAPQNIGFDFVFNGQKFSTFVLNTNGFIKLGSVAPSAATIGYASATGMGNSCITAPDSNLLYPFNRNMIATKESSFKVFTSGKEGQRVCTIEFANLADNVSPAQYTNITFQVKLYETSNMVEFVYNDWTPSGNAATLTVAAVGIKGNSTAESINVAKGSAVTWDNPMGDPHMPYTFMNGNYSAKGPNFGNKNAALPDAGRTYRFTPSK